MDKEVLPHFGKRTIEEISPTDLRILCEEIRDRGVEVDNPAMRVKAKSIATFTFGVKTISGRGRGV